MHEITRWIVDVFERRGREMYGVEEVTQLQHAIQCARRAEQAGAANELVVAALLHDIGHILGEGSLPESCAMNLDDDHEAAGHAFLSRYFGPSVADPVRLHVAAKRYLCTCEPGYQQLLSPTSLKSYFDQGGPMDGAELERFRREPHFREAIELRRWDDLAKDPDDQSEGIRDFVQRIDDALQAPVSLR